MPIFGRNSESQESLDPGKLVETKFGELNTQFSELKNNVVSKEEFKKTQESVDFIANEIKAAKEERKKQLEAQAAKAAKEQGNNYDPEAAFNEFASDPAKALKQATAGSEMRSALALSKTLRNDILGGKEYYHGAFKSEVDSLIDTGTTDPNTLTNPTYIMNCYNLTYAKMAQENKLDEFKRTAAHYGFSDGQGNGKSGEEKDAKPKIDFRGQQNYSAQKAKFAQEQMGITDDDLIDAAKNSVINGLEVVA